MRKKKAKSGREASITGNSEVLRKRAEELLTRDGKTAPDPTEMSQLLHELSVHQIELDLQNQELIISRDDAEASRERYFQLYDLAPIGYAGFGESGEIADINLTGAALIGLERRYCPGRHFRSFLVPEDRRVFDEFLLRVFQSGLKESCMVTLLHDGVPDRSVHIEAILAEPPGPPAPRGPRTCRAAFIDVTEEQRAQRKLADATRYLATIVDSATGPIVVWDPQHRITLFSRGFERLTGRSAATVIGRGLETLFPVPDREMAMAKLRVADGGMMEGVEIPVIAEGGIKDVLWNASALYGQNGAWIATVAIGQEISGLKKTERDLRAKIAELDSANTRLKGLSDDLKKNEWRLSESLAEKEALLGEIHHRVKNNLASFISLLSLDGAYEDTPKGRRLRNDLQNRARTMALIHETLYRTGQFSRVDMNDYLSTLVRQVTGACKTTVPVETRVQCDDIALDLGRSMPAGLIVNELVTNSLKYAWPRGFDCETLRGEPPTLVVGFHAVPGGYHLSVSDNGTGLPEDIDPAHVKSLGLKLVNFLARHQLRAVPELNRDRGTRFLFRIPEKAEVL